MAQSDKDLTLTPLKGKSGQAYIGTYPNGDKIFVKINTTPILAALAKEQIAPQLLWAKRLGNGDMMSAQEWLDGRLLTRADMNSKQIIQVLLQMHKSKPLVNQLLQLNYKVETPLDLLLSWERSAPYQISENAYLQSVVAEMKRNLPDFKKDYATIVHGDVRHSNWVITTSGLVYLVDWDSVRLTDRMFDVAHILSHYIPEVRWKEWLTYYGYRYNETVLKKLYWYGQYAYLCQIAKYYENADLENVNREIDAWRNFRSKYGRKVS